MLLSEQVERIISYHQDLPKRILEVLSRSLGKGSLSASCLPRFKYRNTQAIEYEKGRAVLYRDFVTIPRGAYMQYITKLATSQSQKPLFSLPQIIRGPWAECTAL